MEWYLFAEVGGREVVEEEVDSVLELLWRGRGLLLVGSHQQCVNVSSVDGGSLLRVCVHV